MTRLFVLLFFLLFFLLAFTHIRVYLIEKENPVEGQFVEVDGLKIHYVEKGKGIPVVLEGGGKDWKACRQLTPEFIAEVYGNDKALLLEPKGAPENFSGKEFSDRERSTIAAEIPFSPETISTPKIGRLNLGSGKNTQ